MQIKTDANEINKNEKINITFDDVQRTQSKSNNTTWSFALHLFHGIQISIYFLVSIYYPTHTHNK